MSLQLIPGWAMSGQVFAPLQQQWSNPGQVVDLPGFGSRNRETCPTRLHALARALPPPGRGAVLLGWSLGGMACMQLALQHPGQIGALILVCSTPRFVASPDWPIGTELANFVAFREDFRNNWGKTLRRFLLMQAGKSSGNSRELAQTIRRLGETTPQPSPASMNNGLEILAHADLRSDIRKLSLPVLLVGGKRDRVCHPDASRWMAQQLPNARLLELDCGHAPHLSHTPVLAGEIEKFMQELAA